MGCLVHNSIFAGASEGLHVAAHFVNQEGFPLLRVSETATDCRKIRRIDKESANDFGIISGNAGSHNTAHAVPRYGDARRIDAKLSHHCRPPKVSQRISGIFGTMSE